MSKKDFYDYMRLVDPPEDSDEEADDEEDKEIPEVDLGATL